MQNDSVSPADILRDSRAQRESRPSLSEEYREPIGEIETNLSEIWCDVMHIGSIGRNDNFFDLGGDSLDMLRVANRIRAFYEVEIDFGSFFENPTVAGLSSCIEQSQDDK